MDCGIRLAKKNMLCIAVYKGDSHCEQKRQEDPTKLLQGNRLAWRLNEAVDEMAGKECGALNGLQKEVFIPQSIVMVEMQGLMIYGSICAQSRDEGVFV